MNLNDIYHSYLAGGIKDKLPQKLVFFNEKEKNGFEIESIQELNTALLEFNNKELVIYNSEIIDDEKIHYYFTMQKAKKAYVCIMSHPILSNSYWKDIPDKSLDNILLETGENSKYFLVNYKNGMKDYIIELNFNSNNIILDFLKKKMPAFSFQPNEDLTTSIIFTNTDRFLNLNNSEFVLYSLEEIYDYKNSNIANVSRKLFNEIKNLIN